MGVDDIRRLIHCVVFNRDVHLARLDVVLVNVRDVERHRALLSLSAVHGNGMLRQKRERALSSFRLYVAGHDVLHILVVDDVHVHIDTIFNFFVFRIRFISDAVVEHLRCFVVYCELEVERVSVGVFAARIVEFAFQRHIVSAVVEQVPFGRLDFKLYRRRPVRAARRIRLADIFLSFGVDNLSRRGVFDFNVHVCRAAKKSRINHVHFVDGSLSSVVEHRNGGFFLFGINFHFAFVHLVQVCAELEDVFVVKVHADDFGVRRTCHELIFRRNIGVLLALCKFVGAVIEERSVRPVAVERKIRQSDGDFGRIRAFQRHEAFDVHTVFEALVKIISRRLRKSDFHLDGGRHIRADTDASRMRRTVNDVLDGAVRKHIRFFRNRLVVRRKSFRHNVHGGIVLLDFARYVVDGKLKLVNAGFLFVVVKLDFGLISDVAVFVLDRDKAFRVYSVRNACKSRALFSGRIGVSFVVESNRCGAHKHLIYSCVELNARESGICGFEMLS